MSTDVNRVAVITWLSENASGLGRTALMKYCYLLQTVRGVPLGYRFSLYSYGPFDSDVLSDLDIAESMGGVKTSIVYFPGAYGYRIEPGECAAQVKQLGEGFIQSHEKDLRWVVDAFCGFDAGGLELLSTLIYSDREAVRTREHLTISELSNRVRDLKPKYDLPQIAGYAKLLREKGMLQAVQQAG